MPDPTIPVLRAPAPKRDNPLTRSLAGVIGMVFLGLMVLACLASLPYTLGHVRVPGGGSASRGAGESHGSPRYDQQVRTARHLPPWWLGAPGTSSSVDSIQSRLDATARLLALQRLARERGVATSVDTLEAEGIEPTPAQIVAARPHYWMGSDLLGRSLLIRSLTGGGISLFIGIAAALLSVLLGTLYGAIAGYSGGRTDAVMMRIVDILYGLPYILLVVLLAVASESVIDEFVSREQARERWVNSRLREIAIADGTADTRRLDEVIARLRAAPPDARSRPLGLITIGVTRTDELSEVFPAGESTEQIMARHPTTGDLLNALALYKYTPRQLSTSTRTLLDLTVLFVAIGGVSWLTMARVVRGQVLSLKSQPFMEAARAMGVPVRSLFLRHLLPNLVGPITVYATLTIPQAILQESFLSFLGIGVRPPLPSWGNLAAEGLVELNPYQSRWWLLLFPCLLLGLTLLALNFVGEGLREALDPKRTRR